MLFYISGLALILRTTLISLSFISLNGFTMPAFVIGVILELSFFLFSVAILLSRSFVNRVSALYFSELVGVVAMKAISVLS